MKDRNDDQSQITRPRILCVMMLPPDLKGTGGSQRAWRLVESLSKVGDVHFVLVSWADDQININKSLLPLEPLVASITKVSISEWRGRDRKIARVIHPAVSNVLRFRSFAAPKFSTKAIREIADRLPLRDPDIIFAGRITCASIIQSMIDKKLLSGSRRLVDFDDINSKFRRRELSQTGASWGLQGKMLGRIDAYFIEREERKIAREWDKISVCSDEDLLELKALGSKAIIAKVPNTVAHDLLPEKLPGGGFQCLFVGNLGFKPNTHGLDEFLRLAWPAIKSASPETTLTIVGFGASDRLLGKTGSDGITVHTNVPDLRPYYERADVVIAPILFGGGTRVKILEAMAYGRPVVSTTIGAEGLNVSNGREIFIADTMDEFGRVVVSLSRDPASLRSVAARARAFQQDHFSPTTFNDAMSEFLAA
jgi:glycosyltransferase involved in cell wall biosynthesis